MPSRYRYPGPTPFDADMQHVYHGREDDVNAIYQSLLLNNCIVIAGRSGVGKTSLIKAGLLPLLQQNISDNNKDARQFIIIRLRVGINTGTEQRNLLAMVRQMVLSEISQPGQHKFLSFLEDPFRQTLGFMLKQRQYNDFLENRQPVFLFIFDQLEELFTYSYNNLVQFQNELIELLNLNLPDNVRQAIEAHPDGRRAIDKNEAAILTTPLTIKFLFAIRSDKLSLLIRLKDAIPYILLNPYELKSMSALQATKAITEPALDEGNFTTQPFQFDPAAVQAIITHLSKFPNNSLEDNYQPEKIDPITIQIICRHIEEKIAPSVTDHIIKLEHLPDLNKVFADYYNDTLKGLQLTSDELRLARLLLEEKLIYEPDQRRRQVFIDESGLPETILEQLEQTRLIRQISVPQWKKCYELSHDWLVLCVLEAKKQRQQAEQQNKDQRAAMTQPAVSIVNRTYEGYKEVKEKAVQLLADKDYPAALANFLIALQLKTDLVIIEDDVNLDYYLGETYFRIKDYPTSITFLQKVLAADEKHLLANFYLAYDYHMLRQFDIAVKQYEKLLSFDNSYLNAWFNIGVIYGEVNEWEKAYDAFCKVTEMDVQDMDAWYNAAVMCNKMKLYDEAIVYCDKTLAIKPDYLNANFEKGFALCNLVPAQLQAALDCYDKVLIYDPTNTQAFQNKALVYNAMGNQEEAEMCLLKAASFDGTDYLPSYRLGKLANDGEHYAEAIRYFEKALLLKPADRDTLLEKAYAHSKLNQFEQGIICYNKILSVNPNDDAAYYGSGIMYNKLGQTEQSIQSFNEAIRLKPDSVTNYIEQAYNYHKLADYAQAKIFFEKALALGTEDVQVYKYLGYYKLINNEYDAALEHYYKALNLQPNDADTNYNIGFALKNKNENEQAITYLLKASELKPEDYESAYLLGEAFEAMNEPAKAIEMYRKTQLLKPNFAAALERLTILAPELVNAS